jgi:hypothetical protein
MNLILEGIKLVLGMKLGWVILLVVGVILGLSLIKNIISGSFSVAKFAGGMNPFTGAIQGKLLWLAIWCFIFFTAYSFIMRTTYSYDTDYRNNFNNQGDNLVDQRVGATCIPTKILWGVVTIGCDSGSQKKIVNNTEEKKEVIDQKTVEQPKSNIIPKNKKVK